MRIFIISMGLLVATGTFARNLRIVPEAFMVTDERKQQIEAIEVIHELNELEAAAVNFLRESQEKEWDDVKKEIIEKHINDFLGDVPTQDEKKNIMKIMGTHDLEEKEAELVNALRQTDNAETVERFVLKGNQILDGRAIKFTFDPWRKEDFIKPELKGSGKYSKLAHKLKLAFANYFRSMSHISISPNQKRRISSKLRYKIKELDRCRFEILSTKAFYEKGNMFLKVASIADIDFSSDIKEIRYNDRPVEWGYFSRKLDIVFYDNLVISRNEEFIDGKKTNVTDSSSSFIDIKSPFHIYPTSKVKEGTKFLQFTKWLRDKEGKLTRPEYIEVNFNEDYFYSSQLKNRSVLKGLVHLPPTKHQLGVFKTAFEELSDFCSQ